MNNLYGQKKYKKITEKLNLKMETFIRYDHGFSKVYPNNNNNFTYNRLLAVGINYYLNENWW